MESGGVFAGVRQRHRQRRRARRQHPHCGPADDELQHSRRKHRRARPTPREQTSRQAGRQHTAGCRRRGSIVRPAIGAPLPWPGVAEATWCCARWEVERSGHSGRSRSPRLHVDVVAARPFRDAPRAALSLLAPPGLAAVSPHRGWLLRLALCDTLAMAAGTGQIIEGLWRFEALLPDWTEDEAGEDGWEQSAAWWAVAAPGGVVLIDPLVDDWDPVDRLVADEGGGSGVVRTCVWHQRSVVRSRAATTWASGRDPIQMVARVMALTIR